MAGQNNTSSSFNPDPAQVGEQTWDDAKGISQPGPNTAMASLWSGAGDLLKEGINTADTLTKDYLKGEVRDQAGATQQYFSNALREANNQQLGGKTPPVVPFDPNAGQPPAEVSSAGDKLQGMLGARKNGKMSETYYYGRLDSMAKDLRSRYPGYADYIDSEFEKVTGVNPANAFIKSVLGDINSRVANQKDDFSKKESEVFKYTGKDGTDAMMPLYQKWKANPTEENWEPILANMTRVNMREAQYENAKRGHEIQGISRDDQKIAAGASGQQIVNNVFTDYMNDLQTLQGPSNTSFGAIKQRIQDSLEGKTKVDPVEQQQLGQMLEAKKAELMNRSINMLNAGGFTAKLGDGAAGFEAANNMVKQAATPLDVQINAITNKDLGSYHVASNYVDGIEKAATLGLVTDKDIGPTLLGLNTIRQTGGPNYVGEAWLGMIGSSSSKIGAALKAHDFVQYMSGAKPLTKVIEDLDNPDSPMTPPNGVAGSIKYTQDRTKSLLDTAVNTITGDNNIQTKTTAIKGAFGPGNETLMKKFTKDYIDPDTNKPVVGKYAIFQRLTSQDMISSIKEVGKINPEAWDQYKTWVISSVKDYMVHDTIVDLNRISRDPDIRLNWDDENAQLHISTGNNINRGNVPPGGANVSPSAPYGKQEFYSKEVQRFNQSIQSLVRVFEADGRSNSKEQATAAAVQIMKDQGIKITDPVGAALTAPTIAAVKKEQAKIKERALVGNTRSSKPLVD